MRTVLLLFTLLFRALGVIFNETAYTPPLISACYHKTAYFGPQPGEAGYERKGLLVSIQPETGCENIENAEELKDAMVLIKRGGGCSFFDKAWNIALAGGLAMILGNDTPEDDTLFKMQKIYSETREVDIPCILITWTDYNAAKATIEGSRNGTVIATITPDGEIDDDNWWVLPTLTQFVTCLIIVLPAIWAILTIHYFFRRDMANRRERRQRRKQTRRLPRVVYSKDPEDVANHVTNTTCPICLENFQEKTKINRLPCEHGFHVKCIGTWIAEHSDSCPICRQSVMDKLENAERSSSRFCCCCCHRCSFKRREAGYRQQLLTSDSSDASDIVELSARCPTEVVQVNSEGLLSRRTPSPDNAASLLDQQENNDAMVVIIPSVEQEVKERKIGL